MTLLYMFQIRCLTHIIFYIYYALIFLQFFVHCFSDKVETPSNEKVRTVPTIRSDSLDTYYSCLTVSLWCHRFFEFSNCLVASTYHLIVASAHNLVATAYHFEESAFWVYQLFCRCEETMATNETLQYEDCSINWRN